MRDKLLSLLLAALVINSIFLTHQLWMYQPTYEVVAQPEYVIQSGLLNTKELEELIRPELVVFHYGENKHTVAYPDMFQYNVLYSSRQKWSFYNIREVGEQSFEQLQNLRRYSKGIEFVMPEHTHSSLLEGQMEWRLEQHYMETVSSVLLYENPFSREIHAVFYNEVDQKIYRAQSNIAPIDFEHYLRLAETRGAYQLITVSTNNGNRQLYIPHAAQEVKEFRYFYRTIGIEQMIPFLFEPSLVRHVEDRNGDSFYTDGTRGLHLNREQLSMIFVHPNRANYARLLDSTVALLRSVQYLNSHRGWDHHYYLTQLYEDTEEHATKVEYRRYIEHYPLYGSMGHEDHSVVQLTIQDDRIISYQRPLYVLDRVISTERRHLPAGTEVLEALENLGIGNEQIVRFFIGYLSDFTEYYVNFVPHWIVETEDGTIHYIKDLASLREPPTEDEFISSKRNVEGDRQALEREERT